MGTWTNPNVTQVTSLASAGGITGTPAQVLGVGPTSYQPIVLQNVSSFASYDLNMYGFSTSPGVLVIPVTLQWYDDLVSGIPVFEEDWWIWAGRAAPVSANSYLAASGPMHGQYLTVTISNISTTGLTIQYFNFFGSNRTVPYSDWRQNAVAVNPLTGGLTTGAPNATADAFDNVLLGVDNGAVGAGASLWFPVGLYAGPIYFRFSINAVPTQNITLCSTEGLVSGNLIPGSAGPGILLNFSPAANAEIETLLDAPRAPLALIVHGNAAASAFSCRIIGQQAA